MLFVEVLLSMKERKKLIRNCGLIWDNPNCNGVIDGKLFTSVAQKCGWNFIYAKEQEYGFVSYSGKGLNFRTS